jgi:hypothetical protein
MSLIQPLLPVWPSSPYDKPSTRVAAPRGVFRTSSRTLAPSDTAAKPRAALPVGVAFIPRAH